VANELEQIAKGMIGPGDLNPGGALRPQQAERLISMVFSNGLMEKVTTRRMRRTQADVAVMDIANRSLTRVPQGSEPTDAQRIGANEHGTTLHALPVQLFPQIGLDYLRDNADNKELVSEVEAGFATRMEAELEDLAFNGIDDTFVEYDSANPDTTGWVTLNKGWIQVATDSADTKTASIDPGTNGWQDSLKTARDALPEMYRPNAAIFMNTADADAYAYELGQHVTGTALTADSPLRRFLGAPIITSPYIPAGTVLVTPPKNLVFGLTTEIWQQKRWDYDARALRYTFDTACDYEIAVKQACVLAQ